MIFHWFFYVFHTIAKMNLGLYLEGLGRLLGSTWRVLGASWTQLGRSWGALWVDLGALWITWAFQSVSWAALGGSWARLGGPEELSWRPKELSAAQLVLPKPSADPILEASSSLRCQVGDALPDLRAPLGGTKRSRNNPPRIRATRSKSIDRVDLILWITRKIAADP